MINMLKKVFNWSEVYLSEMTCYKIHFFKVKNFKEVRDKKSLASLQTTIEDFFEDQTAVLKRKKAENYQASLDPVRN